jgi:DNA-binding Lrp family transcriptional regulator
MYKDQVILSLLRQNSRSSLTEMSKKTRIPVSTIYDKLKVYRSGLITKHTSLIDFSKIGYATRAAVLLKAPTSTRIQLKEYLSKHHAVNNFLKINNGYDFFVEAIFKTIQELESFMENLEEKFEINKKETFYIVDEFKRENFLSNPDLIFK